MAKVTAADLTQDVDGAERLIMRHGEFKAEINSRQDSLNRFYDTGNDLIKQVLVPLHLIFCPSLLIMDFIPRCSLLLAIAELHPTLIFAKIFSYSRFQKSYVKYVTDHSITIVQFC